MTRKYVKNGEGVREMSEKPLLSLKEPEIGRTSHLRHSL